MTRSDRSDTAEAPSGDTAGVIEIDPASDRLRWTEFPADAGQEQDGADVIAGLTASPKTLPPKYFYDDVGSLLFEDITDTPEYYPTRSEQEILTARAAAIAAITGPCELVELGSGSSRKTRVLIETYIAAGTGAGAAPAAGSATGSGSGAVSDAETAPGARYIPVDVSGSILKDSSGDLIASFSDLDIWGLIGTYEQALAGLPPRVLDARMILFLGSTIGNLSPAESYEFLRRTALHMNVGEYFLIGYDLRKDPAILEAAYNDAAGVTAAFNLNMLRHLNGRFGGDFDLDAFRHLAFYNRDEHRIEMHLESLRDQTVRLEALDLEVSFAAKETIRTEISRKFTPEYMEETFGSIGFSRVEHFTDSAGRFGLSLFRLD